MGSPPTPPGILLASATLFDVRVEELTGRRQGPPLTWYRQASMLAIRQLTGASYPALGRLFGRDHTTVMQQCGRAKPDLVDAVVEAVTNSSSTTLRSEVEQLRAEVAALRSLVEGDRWPVSPVSPGQLALVVGA